MEQIPLGISLPEESGVLIGSPRGDTRQGAAARGGLLHGLQQTADVLLGRELGPDGMYAFEIGGSSPGLF